MSNKTVEFLQQLIAVKKERIEEIEQESIKEWSAKVVNHLEDEIYEIEEIIRQEMKDGNKKKSPLQEKK